MAQQNGLLLSPTTADGRQRFAVEKTDQSKKTLYSHDWTKPTTWYTTSVRVVDEVATDSGDHLTYVLVHQIIIDSYHGFITNEDFIKDDAGNSYRVSVKVNDVAKVEQDPHYGSGGAYTVDYTLGKITFLAALQANDVVKVTYHYMVDSTFVVKPDAGKSLLIDFAEVQFSDDIVLTDSAVFQPYGYVDVFAPQYLKANGGPLDPGTLIKLGNPSIYKTMNDYQNDAVKAYPVYPAMGGNGWRGMNRPVIVLDWDYVSSTLLRSDYGIEIHIKLHHDTPFGGTYGTATFYCLANGLPAA